MPRARVLHRPDGRGGTERVPARRAVRRPRWCPGRRAAPGPGRRPGRTSTPCRASPGRPSTASPCGRPTRTASPTGCPATWTSSGRCAWAAAPDAAVRPGTAVAMPTGGALPARRRRRRHGRVHAGGDARHHRGRPPDRSRRRRWCGPTRTSRAGARLAPAGRPLRAQDLGLLAAAGIREVRVRARPTVAILSTGDEVVPADDRGAAAGPGAGRHGHRAGGAGHRRRRRRRSAGHRPGRRGGARPGAAGGALRLRPGRRQRRVVGRRPGRDGRRHRRPRAPGHLLPRPGDPARQTDRARRVRRGAGHRAAGQPAVGAGGLPAASACRSCAGSGGCPSPPPEPATRARLGHEVPSVAGRLDVVQVRVCDGVAEPVFGHSALLSVLASADGYVIVPEAATGLAAGSEVDVTLYD